LQFPILKALAADARLAYHLIVGGAHLDPAFGKTVDEIESDGFQIHGQVQLDAFADGVDRTARCIGSGIVEVSRVLRDLQPGFLVVYGDRFESFAAVIAASQMGIATAHIEGGDYTEGGALDDSVRHAMTKLAHLHFTTNREATERVLKLGEEPWRVFTVGLPALDLIRQGQYASVAELTAELGLDPARPVLLFCQHSVATEQDEAAEQVRASLDALGSLIGEGYQAVITYPNDDAGGRAIIAELEKFAALRLPRVTLLRSLGRRRFHGMLNLIGRCSRGAVVGNSSAGIKETPAFGCPTVNIGSRQHGRLRASNVIDVPYSSTAIVAAIRRCAEDENFRAQCQDAENPYGTGNTGQRITEVLATIPMNARLLQKRLTY
jgi:UDP-N-acetylglucosamine 2-epimerase (non-hydrolysing)/GDP/UDP-N,N'-diacetylbacillosamine 2-epimerase (hydrolysing)